MSDFSYDTTAIDVPPAALFVLPPFTHDQSAGICVESALAIARQLQGLAGTPRGDAMIHFTMPTSSCCAMHASYILLMQFHKLSILSQASSVIRDGADPGTERQIEELRHALKDIISTMNTSALTFEAIGRMKGQ